MARKAGGTDQPARDLLRTAKPAEEIIHPPDLQKSRNVLSKKSYQKSLSKKLDIL